MLTQHDYQQIETRLEPKFRQIRDEMISFKDEIMVELRAIREELAAVTYRNIIHQEALENHEERLVSLENEGPTAASSRTARD